MYLGEAVFLNSEDLKYINAVHSKTPTPQNSIYP